MARSVMSLCREKTDMLSKSCTHIHVRTTLSPRSTNTVVWGRQESMCTYERTGQVSRYTQCTAEHTAYLKEVGSCNKQQQTPVPTSRHHQLLMLPAYVSLYCHRAGLYCFFQKNYSLAHKTLFSICFPTPGQPRKWVDVTIERRSKAMTL